MQIDVSLGADEVPAGHARPPFIDEPVGRARSYPDVNRYVCDQARLRMLTVKKLEESADLVVIQAAPTLVSDWPLQDVDLAIALLDSSGGQIDLQRWNNLTLGTWSRSYVPPKAVFRVPVARWKAAFADGQAPKLRIVLDIQE